MIIRVLVVLVSVLLSMTYRSQAQMAGFRLHRMGTMEGQIFFENKPIANAMLAFFNVNKGLPPISGLSGRIPEFLGRADQDGKFKQKLIQGEYYLGILLRYTENTFGPPKEGEVFYFADDGQGKLRKLAIEDFKQIDVGRIDSSLGSVFTETEDHCIVEGTVYAEEGSEPLAGAIVMAKTTPSMRRPQYFSEKTGSDGKFSIKLPPHQTFYLMTRTMITGLKPEVGESIGKYGADTSTDESSAIDQFIAGPPPGADKKDIPKIVADSIPLKCAKNEVISGLKIVMYKRPDQTKLRSENMRSVEAPDYETGFAISNLFFATASAQLDQNSLDELDLWVKFFKGRRDIAIELIGHTDNVGSEGYNLKLSKARAESVAAYLIGKGIARDRFVIQGVGYAKPIADNGTEEGRRKNRRVDIKFEK